MPSPRPESLPILSPKDAITGPNISKKLVVGADYILIDLKVGSGALIKTKSEAVELANMMIDIGKAYNKLVIPILFLANSILSMFPPCTRTKSINFLYALPSSNTLFTSFVALSKFMFSTLVK